MIDLLDRIVTAGGDVWVVGGDLRLRVPKGLLTDQERLLLAEHKAVIVKLLADEAVVETTVVVGMIEPDDEEEIVVPPPQCQQCGGFMFWWDFLGRLHCMTCERTTQVVGSKDPLRMVTIDSQRVREQAARLRKRKQGLKLKS